MALESVSPEFGWTFIHSEEVACGGEEAEALAKVTVLGVYPCVCEAVVVVERGREEGLYLASVNGSGKGFDVCCTCAAVDVILSEGAAAYEACPSSACFEAGV